MIDCTLSMGLSRSVLCVSGHPWRRMLSASVCNEEFL
jgi:hypothetical protein